jgi:hypothetical protein
MYYVASAAPAIMFYLIEGSFGTGKEPLKLKITALDSEREADRSHPHHPSSSKENRSPSSACADITWIHNVCVIRLSP